MKKIILPLLSFLFVSLISKAQSGVSNMLTNIYIFNDTQETITITGPVTLIRR